MLIDWYTFVAQIINFIILVWLLKRFLYQPVLNAIDEREGRIARQMQEAEKGMKDAKAEQEEFQRKNREFDHQRNDLLQEAKEEVRQKKAEMMKTAKKEFDAFRDRIRHSLQQEQKMLDGEIMRRTASEVFSIARKTLKDLADTDIEAHVVDVFLDRLKNLGTKEKSKLEKAFGSSKGEVSVKTAFELSKALRARVHKTLDGLLKEEVKVRYTVDPEQLAGIELAVHKYKLAWNILDYTAALEATVMDVLEKSSFDETESPHEPALREDRKGH